MTQEPMLVLERVSVGYPQHTILNDISLTIQPGSFTAVLGANGSGKTTLLKSIAGILPVLAGTIQYRDLNGGEPRLGYVPQRESLDPLFLLSGFEVALMGTYGRARWGRAVASKERDLTWKCLQLTGAEGFAQTLFAELSGGQKQRVLIARALAARPHLLLMDEPTSGVDSATSDALLEVLATLSREQGLTAIMVTHDLPTVRKHVPQVMLVHHGRTELGDRESMLAPHKLTELLELTL